VPSIECVLEVEGGLEDSKDEPYRDFSELVDNELVDCGSGSVRYRRVSSMKNDAGPLENSKYVVFVSGPLRDPGGTGGFTET